MNTQDDIKISKGHILDTVVQKKFLLAFIIISLFLRFGLALALEDSFFERGNRSSSISPIAENIIRHYEFARYPGDPTASEEPLYTFFIALCYFLFGKNWFGVLFLQSLLCLLNGFIIYKIALLIFKNETTARLSFIFVILYPFYITQSINISDTVFFTLFLALSTYLTLLSAKKIHGLTWILTGLSWGFTLQVRFSAVALFPFALLYVLMNREQLNSRLKKAALIFVVSILTLMPWLYRNYSLTGKIFLTSHADITAWLGYNKDTGHVLANDISVDVMKKNLDEKIPELKELKKKKFPNSISLEAAKGRLFYSLAFKYVRENPWESIKLMPLKLWKFWSPFKNPRTNSLEKNRSSLSTWWDIAYTFYYLPILLLAVMGMFFSRKKWKDYSLILLLFLGYSLLHTVVYGFTRLRVPLDQFLIIFACVAIYYFYKNKLPDDKGLSLQ